MLSKEKIIIICIFLLMILGLVLVYKRDSDDSNNLKIYFFNAGKADAIIISKNNKYMMIDTGEEELSGEILNYFRNNNITKLDYLIITHFDKDHVGSAASIISSVEIGEVLQSNVPKDSEYYNNYLMALQSKEITPVTVSGDYELNFDDLEILVNGPQTIYDSNESNNSSLIVSITNGENKFLFMGDSQNARIKDFLSNNNDTYDFLKVPYHGNYLKQLDNLLDSINAKYGVVTCSNSEGCDEEALSVLDNYNVKYYLTRNGGITITSDGNNIKFKQY